ncbi:MAG: TetR/AcrR family transcriptional regulator [Oxalobacteraceae bacterium]|jgi:AcrR family transcriptional regulator|nr:MAG: TetR/AcrR family transcriptional regulator [Oxalobacteraceae bacterium]
MKGTQKKIGRPLSFDRAEALEQAMLTFWRYGYESTSISALTAAMSVTPPSLYATFGDKKQLFLEAMQLYAGDATVIAATLDAEPSARAGAAMMLEGAAIAFTGESTPPGCLLASATASGSATSADVQAAVAAVRAEICALLRQRIVRDIREGKLAADCDAQALADLIMGTIQGMSVLARDGISRTRLLSLAQQVLVCFPQN